MTLRRFKILNALDLKLLAMALMLCDHLWATLVPGADWLTCLGRLAFPIFAFQVAEGYCRTGNFRRYLGRMFLWALLTEIPFNLMYGGSVFSPFHQNVLFTFCLALVLMRLLDWARQKNRWLFLVMIPVALALGYGLGFVTMVDYFGFGVVTVLVFYLLRGLPFAWLGQLAALAYINGSLIGGMTMDLHLFGLTLMLPQQALAVLALLPIWMYNGKQGPHSRAIQYACYAFYPVHMLVLAVLALYVL